MPEKVYSVVALTRSIRRNLLANNDRIAGVWIEGEVSGSKVYSSGHRYFTLKGAEGGVDAQMSCVLFAFCLSGCDDAFRRALAQGEDKVNGLKVQVQGELDLNMGRGQYSFKVARVRLKVDEIGARMAQFNALKAKIEEEGLDKLNHPERRRRLPRLPHRIGIVTSPAGAVIHDMCDVILRRFPDVEIRLYPAKVQGEGAAASVVAGIRFFSGESEGHGGDWRPDVLIVGRGGGSVEDLWAFNEEPLVRAVAASAVPVVSAVGHESDVTLCDYVADLRAGTPSIAGEYVVPVKAELDAKVGDLAARLARAPRQTAETRIQQLDFLSHRLASAPTGGLARCEQRLQRAALRLEPPVRAAEQRAVAALAALEQKLELLNPYAVLGRGYSITLDADGHVVRAAGDVKAGDRLATRLGDGVVESVAV